MEMPLSGLWSWPALLVGAGVVVGIGVLVAVGVRYLESQSRRDERALVVQTRIAQRLARARVLEGASIMPTVSLGHHGPVSVELAGHVTSSETRALVLALVRREAERLGRGATVTDRLEVRAPAEAPPTQRSA